MLADALRVRKALRDSEWAVLSAALQLCRDGWPVHVRELQRYTNLHSTQTVHGALVDLQAKGLVETSPRNRRDGWKATQDGYDVVNA